MIPVIQPIETCYDGYRFRSRLEARWAVFFRQLGIPYEYEAQGYTVSGTPYLPDFRLTLPNNDIVIAEVKNSEVDEEIDDHVELCRGLSKQLGCMVTLLTGTPWYRMYNAFTPDLPIDSLNAVFFRDYDPLIVMADKYWFQSVECDPQTGHLNFTHNERGRRKSFGPNLVAAVEAARGARFEHGGEPS